MKTTYLSIGLPMVAATVCLLLSCGGPAGQPAATSGAASTDLEAETPNTTPLLFAAFHDTSAVLIANPQGKYNGALVVPPTATVEGRELPVVGCQASTFADCTELTSVTLPASFTRHAYRAPEGIAHNATNPLLDGRGNMWWVEFAKCERLQAIHVAPGHPFLSSQNGLLLSADGRQLLLCPHGRVLCTIPEGVEHIREAAFTNAVANNMDDITTCACKHLQRVHFPRTLKSIGDGAFFFCESLDSLCLDSTQLTAIGNAAFYGCQRLKEVNLPGTLRHIGDGAFFRTDTSAVFRVAAPLELISIGARSDNEQYNREFRRRLISYEP